MNVVFLKNVYDGMAWLEKVKSIRPSILSLVGDQSHQIVKDDFNTIVMITDNRVYKAYTSKDARDNCIGVSKHINISIPKILEYGDMAPWYYLVEEKWDGEVCDVAHEDDMDEQLLEEIGRMVDKYRTLRFDKIGNFDINGNIVKPHDTYSLYSLWDDVNDYNTFDTVSDFNKQRFNKSINRITSQKLRSVLGPMYSDDKQSFITLAHNDLAPRNIMCENNHLVGIIDWEMSGAFPDTYEVAKNKFYQTGTLTRVFPPLREPSWTNERIISWNME